MLYQCVLYSNDEDIAAQVEWGDKLSNSDIELISMVRKRNESYLMAGLDYQERKKRLLKFVMQHNTKKIEQCI
jgi:hypothetical protein